MNYKMKKLFFVFVFLFSTKESESGAIKRWFTELQEEARIDSLEEFKKTASDFEIWQYENGIYDDQVSDGEFDEEYEITLAQEMEKLSIQESNDLNLFLPLFTESKHHSVLKIVLKFCDISTNLNLRLVSKKFRENLNNLCVFPTPIYHFTHINNLEKIFKNGKLLSHNTAHPEKDVSNSGVQNLRANKVVYGHSLHDYVPFYYTRKTPMLYVVTKINRVSEENLVFFKTYTQRLMGDNKNYSISNMNASRNASKFSNKESILYDLNWKGAIRLQYWNDRDPEKKDKKKAEKQAEFLSLNEVLLSDVRFIIASNKETAEKVGKLMQEMGVKGPNLRMFTSSAF